MLDSNSLFESAAIEHSSRGQSPGDLLLMSVLLVRAGDSSVDAARWLNRQFRARASSTEAGQAGLQLIDTLIVGAAGMSAASKVAGSVRSLSASLIGGYGAGVQQAAIEYFSASLPMTLSLATRAMLATALSTAMLMAHSNDLDDKDLDEVQKEDREAYWKRATKDVKSSPKTDADSTKYSKYA